MLVYALANYAYACSPDPTDSVITNSTCVGELTQRVKQCIDEEVSAKIGAGNVKGSVGVSGNKCTSKELQITDSMDAICANSLKDKLVKAVNSKEYYYWAQCTGMVDAKGDDDDSKATSQPRYSAQACIEPAHRGKHNYKATLLVKDAGAGFPAGGKIVWTNTGRVVAGGNITAAMHSFQTSQLDAFANASWEVILGSDSAAVTVTAADMSNAAENTACTLPVYFGVVSK